MPAQYGNLPFQEAIDFFRGKVKMPSGKWSDFTKGMHSRAFVVAGATKQGLLCDLYSSVQKAIEKGTTLYDFRNDFDDSVKKWGWNYKGEKGWRTRTIFETNLSNAYAVGRYKQMEDSKEVMPYWRYRTADDSRVRSEHAQWNNVILPADDPWWNDHYPPNGYGCRCWVEPVTKNEYQSFKDAKGFQFEAPNNGSYEWKNPSTGETEQIPKGIDPGWNYNPGKAAWGEKVQADVMAKFDTEEDRWTPVDTRGPDDFGRGDVPVDVIKKELLPLARTEDQLRKNLRDALEGDEAFFVNPVGETVCVNQGIADHIMEKPETRMNGREQYFGLIPDVIMNPYEIWVGFEKRDLTGEYRIVERYCKNIDIKGKSLGIVARVVNNQWAGYTFFMGKKSNLKNLRVGALLYGR